MITWLRLRLLLDLRFPASACSFRVLFSSGAIRRLKEQVEQNFGTDFVKLRAQAAREESKERAKKLKAGL